MTNQFDSSGGEQNIAQGENAIGKQENTTQPVSGDGNIFSGTTGNVTVNKYGVRVKTRTVLLASALAAAVFGGGLAAWQWLAPVPPPAKSAATAAPNSPAIITDKGNVTVTYNNSVIPPQRLEELAGKLAVTDSALASFFKILEEQQVPPGDLDAKLREIAAHYKELLHNWEAVQSADPEVVKLKTEAKQAIESGDYAKAEALLDEVANRYNIAAAEANADNARLQRVQLRHAKAAAYWQKAAALLPEESKKERALYLHEAGYDLWRIAKYKEALPLYEQSLSIRREIGDKAGEGTTLNNIGLVYHEQGDYDKALSLYEQSLAISREINDKVGIGGSLNDIGMIYDARGDYATALPYLEQSLSIRQEIGDRHGEGESLNNIATIHYAKGDYAAALKHLKQSLVIYQKIGDRGREGRLLNNISQIYDAQGDYATALKHLEHSLSISREVSDKSGEGTTLSNIASIHWAQGHYTTALKYLEQSLSISREIGDKKQEGVTLNNIGQIYDAQGDYITALKHLEQSLVIHREVGNRALEGTTLNNIGKIYFARGDYAAALKHLEQSLRISREIGDRRQEAETSWNIGRAYEDQGDLAKAEAYISRSVQLAEELGHPKLEECRKALEAVRAKLRGR